MDVGTLELVELDEALDFEIVCEQPSGCSQSAEWFGVTNCGCQEHYACNVHMMKHLTWETDHPSRRCGRCRAADCSVIWTHLKHERRNMPKDANA